MDDELSREALERIAVAAARRGARDAGCRRRPGLAPSPRQFATELKHVPLKDLAELGGWKCAQTILTCYQQADQATMRQALATRQRLEARA